MKKVIISIMVVLMVPIVVLLGNAVAKSVNAHIIKKDLESDKISIIMTLRSPMESKSANETKLYRHNMEEQILLAEGYDFYDIVSSKDGSKILSFMGHGREKFDIVEYDLESKTPRKILNTEEIKAYLIENGYMEQETDRNRYGYCPRYYRDENCISFQYDKFLMGYSEQEGLEVIYTLEDYGHAYSWIKDDTVLLICDGGIVEYNTDTGERKTLFEQAHTFNFAVSPDEEFVVYEERDTGYLCRYDLKDGTKQELCKYKHPLPILQIYGDGQYLLYQDAVQVLSSYKSYIYVMDIESRKKWKVYECGVGTPFKSTQITGVAWN